MTKLKPAIVGTVGAVAIVTPVIIQHQSESRLREQNRILQEQQSKVSQLAAENERLSNLLAQANREQPMQQDRVHELLKLRGEVTSLRQQSKELAHLQEENRALRAQQDGWLNYWSA